MPKKYRKIYLHNCNLTFNKNTLRIFRTIKGIVENYVENMKKGRNYRLFSLWKVVCRVCFVRFCQISMSIIRLQIGYKIGFSAV